MREPCVATLRTDRHQIGMTDRHHWNTHNPMLFQPLDPCASVDGVRIKTPALLIFSCGHSSIPASIVRSCRVIAVSHYLFPIPPAAVGSPFPRRGLAAMNTAAIAPSPTAVRKEGLGNHFIAPKTTSGGL